MKKPISFAFALYALGFGSCGYAQTAPVITNITSPRQLVAAGANLTLSVTATNATSYKWRKNGTPLPGATSASYTLTTNAPFSGYAWYDVEVSSSNGNAVATIVSPAIFVLTKPSSVPSAMAAWGSTLIYPNYVDASTMVPSGIGSVFSIAAGDAHNLAIKQDGTVIGWGANSYGQVSIPADLRTVVAIAGGNAHSIALKEDGTVSMWGLDYDGKSVLPSNLTGVVAIATCSSYNLALKQDGTVVAWGAYSDAMTSIPTGLSNVVAIAAGAGAGYALKQDGTVASWGSNSRGERDVPAGLTGVSFLAAGSGHAAALRSDGTVVAWGQCFSSSGSIVSAASLIPPNLSGVVGISAANFNVAAIRQDGSIRVWGYNGSGQTNVPPALKGVGLITISQSHLLALFDATGYTVPVIAQEPRPTTLFIGDAASLSVVAAPTFPALTYQWRKNGVSIQGATASTMSIARGSESDTGSYDVTVTNYIGSVTSKSVAVTVNPVPAPAPASILVQPSGVTANSGESVVLEVSVGGYPSPTIQWFKDGTAIAGATSSTLTISQASSSSAGSYTATATNTVNGVRFSTTTSSATVVVNPANALSNLSVRTTMAEGQILIVGAVVSGGAKTILIRAGGPALNQFGLSGMTDPRLELYTTGTAPVATNDDWPGTLATTFAGAGAYSFAAGSKDAALSQNLSGTFTVQTKGTGPGALLVEAYDVTGGTSARLINISARNKVGTGGDILIAGFNISGTGTKQLLVRGIGPGLAQFGVTGYLADPKIQIFDTNNVLIGSSDNWNAALASTFTSVGAFSLPPNSKDAALLVSLKANASYTVWVSGADGGTGDGIVEIYEVP